MLRREFYLQKISEDLDQFKVCALLGPRQCGKTTLATDYVSHLQGQNTQVHIFDLEDPDHLNALENPKLVFERLEGLIVMVLLQIRLVRLKEGDLLG